MSKYSFVGIAHLFFHRRAITFSILTVMLFLIQAAAFAQAVDHTSAMGEAEVKELNLYRQSVPKLFNNIRECEEKSRKGDVTQDAYDAYVSTFYRQASDFRNQRLKLYEWQLFASNSVLAVVLIMSIGGFIITALQIYQLYKLNAVTTDTKFEVSLQQIRITTSVTGILVLVISFLFLVVFLQEVYRIHPAAGGTNQVASESK